MFDLFEILLDICKVALLPLAFVFILLSAFIYLEAKQDLEYQKRED